MVTSLKHTRAHAHNHTSNCSWETTLLPRIHNGAHVATVYFTVFVLSALGSLSFYILLSGVALQDDLLLALCSFSHLLLPDRMLMPGWRRSRCISSDFFESQAAPLSPPLAAVPWWMSLLASACGACGATQIRPLPAYHSCCAAAAAGELPHTAVTHRRQT